MRIRNSARAFILNEDKQILLEKFEFHFTGEKKILLGNTLHDLRWWGLDELKNLDCEFEPREEILRILEIRSSL